LSSDDLPGSSDDLPPQQEWTGSAQPTQFKLPVKRISAPSYIPAPVWIHVVRAAILGRCRLPQADGEQVLQELHPSPTIGGLEHLPESGPCLVVANHFNGPGVWVGLPAALLSAVIGRARPDATVRGVGVAAYHDARLWGIVPIPEWLTEAIFCRFYAVYGIIRMPNMPAGAQRRSTAARAVLKALSRGDVVLLFPEGGNVSQFIMRRIQIGVGNLVALAGRAGVPIVPGAVTVDADGRFCVCLGPAITTGGRSGRELEDAIGAHIAEMLPPELRGPYA